MDGVDGRAIPVYLRAAGVGRPENDVSPVKDALLVVDMLKLAGIGGTLGMSGDRARRDDGGRRTAGVGVFGPGPPAPTNDRRGKPGVANVPPTLGRDTARVARGVVPITLAPNAGIDFRGLVDCVGPLSCPGTLDNSRACSSRDETLR